MLLQNSLVVQVLLISVFNELGTGVVPEEAELVTELEAGAVWSDFHAGNTATSKSPKI